VASIKAISCLAASRKRATVAPGDSLLSDIESQRPKISCCVHVPSRDSAPERELMILAFRIRGAVAGAALEVCRSFGISRKIGYKIFNRYKEQGLEALTDRCRRPGRYANQLAPQLEALIVTVKREKPHWGARKIRELLIRRLDGDIRIPAKSTVHAVLHRHGLVKGMSRPRRRATGTPLSAGAAPNDLLCADVKGEFKLGSGPYCYPLTVTDHASRFLLMCEAMDSTREESVITAFEQLFRERGLPRAIRSDSGVPEQKTLRSLDNPFGT